MAAKHARANAMAQTITLLELMIKSISLSVRCVKRRGSGFTGLGLRIFKGHRYSFVHA